MTQFIAQGDGAPFEYGTVAEPRPLPGFPGLQKHKRGPHRFNSIAILVNLVFPWLFFSVLFTLTAAPIHDDEPGLCAAVSVISAGLIWMLYMHVKRQQNFREPSWCLFFLVTIAIAWVLAVVVGNILHGFSSNYKFSFEPLKLRPTFRGGRSMLNSYSKVDASSGRGTEYMDAGVLKFKDGTFVDVNRTMVFKHGRTYCVAPLATNTTYQHVREVGGGTNTILPNDIEAASETRDFWVVGKDCCSRQPLTFTCSNAKNPLATTGLRLLNDDDRMYYRLAVQQAEASYRLKAVHPIFVTLTEDTRSDIQEAAPDLDPVVLEHMSKEKKKSIAHIVWIFISAHAVFQAFCVATACAFFARSI